MSKVTILHPCPFEVGEKLHIEAGPRRGDWLVTGCDERKLTLQCPVSKREFSWDRFCFQIEKREQEWPMRDED
ncbi:MAG: hypothetical protein ABFR63_02615 [Thermodesulfobacteriota bacterium]